MNSVLTTNLSRTNLALPDKLSESWEATFDHLYSLENSTVKINSREILVRELLDDPEEDQFFNELKDRVLRDNLTGLSTIEVIASSLIDHTAGLLSDTMRQRLSELLSSAPYSPAMINLALVVLAGSQYSDLCMHIDSNEELAIPALRYLSKVEPQLTFEQRSKIFTIASNYEDPVGLLDNGTVSFENLTSDLDTRFDIAGAGCILLLSRFSIDDLFNIEMEAELPLEDLAISFSKDYPSEPNLWINVMENVDPGALKILDDYQKDRLPNDMAISITKNAMNETLTASLLLFVSAQIVIKLINAPVQGLWQTVTATLGATGAAGLLRFMNAFLVELRKHKISKEHKLQLAVALEEYQED
jgi:hypothetical protein